MTNEVKATRSILVETRDGPVIMDIEVDPPNDNISVDIDIEEPAISRVITPTISNSLLASLIGQCRPRKSRP